MIYLDNASTSWPKPAVVPEAMAAFLRDTGANPSRSGHKLSIKAGKNVLAARISVAEFFGESDPLRVIFTHNITTALNTVLRGFLRPGDNVVTTGMEHNAVMRPLRRLETSGVHITIVPCSSIGLLDPDDLRRRLNSHTRLIVINHASNVCGTVQPVAEVGAIAREQGIPLLLDTAQSAGCFPVHMEESGVDILAFTGHKGLLGPTGTGGLVFAKGFDPEQIDPLITGGTGSASEKREHPEFLPDRFEAGTINACGIASLAAGIKFISTMGMNALAGRKQELAARLVNGLMGIEGVEIQGDPLKINSAPVVSMTTKGISCSSLAQSLDEGFEIACRAGLHCAPAAHMTLGTFPEGSLRLSPGIFNTIDEMDMTVNAIRELVEEERQ